MENSHIALVIKRLTPKTEYRTISNEASSMHPKKEQTMEHAAGLDISLQMTAIFIVDEKSKKIVKEIVVEGR